MFHKYRVIQAFILVVAFSLLTGLVAYATIIVVDGDPTDWPGNPTCTILASGCSKLADDPAESGSTTMPPGTDVRTVWGTNSSTDLFFRFDTEAATTNFGAGEFLRVCLDIPSQSPGQANVGGCLGLNVDRLLLVTNFGPVGVRAYDCNAVDCNSFFAIPTGSGTFAQSGTVNELSVPLNIVGLGTPDDGITMSTMVYFDNNGLPPDDNIPDSGTSPWPVGSGSPTAVTLQSFSADNSSTLPMVGIAVVAVFALISAGVYIFRREQKQA